MQNARFAAAISRASEPTTFPMMLSYNGNCLLQLSCLILSVIWAVYVKTQFRYLNG
jgi:hypothetical protein